MVNRFNLKNRNNILCKRNIMIFILFMLITCFGIGFASYQSKLDMVGEIALEKTKFDVIFDNAAIETESEKVAGNSVTISDDLQSVNFVANLSKENSYFEFEVDAVNDGIIDAMVSGVKIEGLDDNLNSYISVKMKYRDKIAIESNQFLKAGVTERIKIRVEVTDLSKLSTDVSLDLTLEMFYVQATDEAFERPINYFLNDIIRLNASKDTNIDFSLESSDTNGKGVYYRNVEGHTIYYYRGDVYNNNLIFADYCWKIVRTTETDGSKIIYNGKVDEKGTCPNTIGEDTQIQTSIFYSKYNAAKYAGYMYEENGNQVNSTIKDVIDSWYENNILDKYDAYLEDTVWCNDKSVSSTSGSYIYYGANERIINKYKPSLSCALADSYTLKNSVKGYNSKLNGNELLDYPVALLTADEISLAGASSSMANKGNYYLNNGQTFWTLSPSHFTGNFVVMIRVSSGGSLYNDSVVSKAFGVRPAVSLASGTLVTTTNIGEPGTAENPYVVITD